MARSAAVVAILISAAGLHCCDRAKTTRGERGAAAQVEASGPAPGPHSAGAACDFSEYRPLRGSFDGVVLRQVKPAYPAAARAAQAAGTVWVEVLVDGTGTPVRACATDGPGVFRPASEEAALQWKFKPLLLNQQPRHYVHKLRFEFTLSKQAH